MIKINLFLLLFILLLNNAYWYIEEWTWWILKEYNTIWLKCIKYNDFVSWLKDTNSDFFTVMNNNFYLKDKKNKKEADNYNKFDQCSLSYTTDYETYEMKDFKVYNKYTKTYSNVYDKIFEDTVMFDDYTNECSFSAKKWDESIFILHWKEIWTYSSIIKMATVNTSDWKSKIVFSAEKKDWKIAIVENWKELFYSDKEEYKKWSLIYTNDKKIAFIEKDPLFWKEHLIIDWEQIPEYSWYEIEFWNTDSDIFFVYSAQSINKYWNGDNFNFFINWIKVKYKFNWFIWDIQYLSNWWIIYRWDSLDSDKLSHLVINWKLSKWYKSFERLYDLFSIHEQNVPFIETKNWDIYFIAKNEDDKYVVVKNDKEIFIYNNKPDVNFKNTNHFIYTIENENWTYSLVVDWNLFWTIFDEKPQINNQYLLDTSKEWIFMLDFRYDNFNNLCKYKDSTNTEEYKNILLRKQFDEKFSNIFSKYWRDIDNMKSLRKRIFIMKHKLKKFSNKNLSIKSKNIIKIIDELLVWYLENINLVIKNLEKDKNLNNINTKVKYFSESQINSWFFDEKTGKLKNNYNINDFLNNSSLFNFIHVYFNNTSVITDDNIVYFKENIKKYIEKNGYNVKENFKVWAINKDWKYSWEKVFVIESKYINWLSNDKRLIIWFWE